MKLEPFFLACLFLVPLVFAQAEQPEDGGLRSDVRGIPQSIVASERAQAQQDNAEFVNPQLQLIRSILTSNIDPNAFEDLWKLIVSILSLFYLLLFALAGFRMVLGAHDAGQREQAKEELKHAFIVLVLVNASLLLYSLALNVSSSVSSYLYDSVFQEKDEYFASMNQFPAFNPIAWLLIGVSLLGVIVTLAVRDLILILGVMLLPI